MANSMMPPSSGVPRRVAAMMPIGMASPTARMRREQGKLQRGRHPFHDQGEGRRARAQRVAQVKARQAAYIVEVLFMEGAIKAQLGARLRPPLHRWRAR